MFPTLKVMSTVHDSHYSQYSMAIRGVQFCESKLLGSLCLKLSNLQLVLDTHPWNIWCLTSIDIFLSFGLKIRCRCRMVASLEGWVRILKGFGAEVRSVGTLEGSSVRRYATSLIVALCISMYYFHNSTDIFVNPSYLPFCTQNASWISSKNMYIGDKSCVSSSWI